MEKEAFLALVEKYLQGTASGPEEQLLFRYYDALQAPDAHGNTPLQDDEESIRKQLLARISDQLAHQQATPTKPLANWPVVRALRPAKWGYVAAILVVSGLVAVYLAFAQHNTHSLGSGRSVARTPTNRPTGPDRAILTLASGEKIKLDQLPNGLVAKQGATLVHKTTDGQIRYTPPQSATQHTPQYNTLTTPKGAQYRLTLPDGSIVWLNAASSIRFPVIFDPRRRCVNLSGEAYFEVAPLPVIHSENTESPASNQKVPFVVQTGNQRIDVLGTHFNVNAYSDEASIKTTLLEGTVRVSHIHRGNGWMLRPGQQAQVRPGPDTPIRIVAADVQASIAWKNGYFNFDDESLGSIMRKLARWYDIQVRIDPALANKQFTATISRRESLLDVLTMLQLTGAVQFKIDTLVRTTRVTEVTVTP